MAENESNELIPPAGDKDVGFIIFRILDEILTDKELLGLSKKWQRNYELSRNRHWKGTGGAKVSLVSANLLHDHRQKTVNMLTDNNPVFNVAMIGGPGDVDEQMQEDLLHCTEYWWNEQEQQSVLESSVITGEIYGCTVEKVIFNDELEYGMGEVETELVDPYHFGFYPVKCKKLQKAEAVLHYIPMSVREARRTWPDKAEMIRADSAYLEDLNDNRREMSSGGAAGLAGSYYSTLKSVVKKIIGTSGDTGSDSDETLVVECWVKDYSINPETGLPLYQGFIRCITTCNGGAMVLSDKSNPSINPLLPDEQAQKTYLYDKFPFSLTPSITDPLIPWGMSDFEQLEQLQTEINKSISQITLFKDKASRLKIINPQDSGVPNAHFTNYPGILNPSSSMTAQGIRYMDPPQIPSDMIEILKIYQELFYKISGEFDMEQANSQGANVIAYKAIQALIERATTMLKGKIRNYGKMTRERGRMFLSHVLNWYTEDRWVTWDEDGESVSRQINGTIVNVPVKLTVVSGSTMPKSRVQEREEAIELFSKGAIDAEELLKKMDWSGRKQVVKRMQAGPFGALIEKIAAMGMPQPIIQAIQEISQTDDKEFKALAKRDEIPQVGEILQQMAQGGMEQPNMTGAEYADMHVKDAEIKKIEAEAEKIKAEIQLVLAQIDTERSNQTATGAGIQFDSEKINIEKAQTLNQIEDGKHRRNLDKANFLHSREQAEADKTGKYDKNVTKTTNEMGKDGKPKASTVETQTVPADSDFSGDSNQTAGQGPFREKGMVSDNEEKK
jgi:hypothetical protein